MASNHQWWIGGPSGFPFCSLSADKYLRSSPCSRKGLGPHGVDGQEKLACFHGEPRATISFKENEQEWNGWRENGQDSWVLFGHVTYEEPLWFCFYRKMRLKIVWCFWVTGIRKSHLRYAHETHGVEQNPQAIRGVVEVSTAWGWYVSTCSPMPH